MKKSWSFISMLAALALGTASAAGTTAGTQITNTAEIVFTPEVPTGTTPPPPTTVPSNPVVTTVLPVPSFTITPNDLGAAGPTFVTENNDLKKDLKPGDTAVFLYTLTNTGNVPNESYGLTSLTDSLSGAPKPTDVRYYPISADSNNDGVLSPAEIAAAGTPITTITGVGIDKDVKFFQVYTVPTTAVDGNKLGADPVGTRLPNAGTNLEPAAPFTQPVDNDNYNTVTVNRTDAGVIGPKSDPDGNGTPITPAYPSTDPTPVTVTPTATDTQEAPATTTTTQITFTNTVQNNGNRPDVFDITTVQDNFPGATVVLYTKNPDGSKGPVLPDTDGDGKPDTGSLQPGEVKDILVQVTFPAGTQPADPLVKPTVVVTATSSNDPTKSDSTKDIVNLPKVSFGDPTPTPGGDITPPQTGTPPVDSTGTPVNPGTPQCVTTVTSYFAMEVANLGTAPDLFNISGVAPIKLTSGNMVTPTPKLTYYRDVNGDGKFDSGDTLLTDTNADGIADTGLIAPNTEVKLIAALAIPCDAAAQTIVLNQTATSPISGVTVTDPNDTVTVGTTPVATPDKKGPATAKPGELITYTIVGKNTSNANITKAFVKDTVPANTAFTSLVSGGVTKTASWTATSTAAGTILYSTNGTSWSPTAPAVPQADGTTFYAAVDTNGDSTITIADILKPGESITVTFSVIVK